jgi:hypothetical protein
MVNAKDKVWHIATYFKEETALNDYDNLCKMANGCVFVGVLLLLYVR